MAEQSGQIAARPLVLAVTGASGFIGTNLRANARCQVRAVDRSLSFDDDASALINLAWYADPSDYLTSDQNTAASDHAIAAAHAAARRKLPFIGVGTCVEYAESPDDLREDHSSVVQEGAGSLYALEKLRALRETRRICDSAGIRWVWARIFFPFGPDEKPERLVPSVVRAVERNDTIALGPCVQIRDQIDVRDVAEALVVLADSDADGVYNVATGSAPPLRRWLTDMAGDRSSLLRFADPELGQPSRTVGDSTRLRSLGWLPTHASPPTWRSLTSSERIVAEG